MRVNIELVTQLMQERNITQTKLANIMEVSDATVSRVLNGKRGVGKEVIAGLLLAFPDKRIDEIFFLH